MKHIGIFGEESRVYAQVKNHRLPERTVQQKQLKTRKDTPNYDTFR
jgi:hypothetical protein